MMEIWASTRGQKLFSWKFSIYLNAECSRWVWIHGDIAQCLWGGYHSIRARSRNALWRLDFVDHDDDVLFAKWVAKIRQLIRRSSGWLILCAVQLSAEILDRYWGFLWQRYGITLDPCFGQTFQLHDWKKGEILLAWFVLSGIFLISLTPSRNDFKSSVGKKFSFWRFLISQSTWAVANVDCCSILAPVARL